jgi:protein tyrosine phosphatase
MVMLTREMEGAQVKCGKYWEEGVYGSIMLTRVGKGTPGGGAGAGAGASGAGGGPAAGGGFFNPAPSTSGSGSGGDKSTTVRREFELRHKDFPKAGVRRVTQIQYTGWDDMHVPEDAQDLLGVVKAVRELQDPAEREVREAKGTTEVEVNPVTGVVRSSQPPPVLLHCSAGIGRTGGFIALDAALDAVRQEVRAQRSAPVQASNHVVPGPAPPSFNLPSRAPDARNRRVEEIGELDATRRPSAKRMLSDVGVRGPHASSHSHAQPDGAADSMAMDVSSSRGHPHAHAGFASGTGGMRTPALEHPPVLGSAYGSSSTTNSTSTSTTQSPYAVPLPPTPAFTIPPTPATADTEGELCYRPPRTLHQGNAPVPLDALPGGAPIYALVADMREQRMSLVQTLRQYVFVHFAVLQGALEIVDEEGRR